MKNKEIEKLQKRKWYYKTKGDFERVRTIEIMIDIERRKIKMEEDNEKRI